MHSLRNISINVSFLDLGKKVILCAGVCTDNMKKITFDEIETMTMR